jgi:hypothetical protein
MGSSLTSGETDESNGPRQEEEARGVEQIEKRLETKKKEESSRIIKINGGGVKQISIR